MTTRRAPIIMGAPPVLAPNGNEQQVPSAVAHRYSAQETGREIDYAHGQGELASFCFGKHMTLREERVARIGGTHTGISYRQRYLRQYEHYEGSPIILQRRGNEMHFGRAYRKPKAIESAQVIARRQCLQQRQRWRQAVSCCREGPAPEGRQLFL